MSGHTEATSDFAKQWASEKAATNRNGAFFEQGRGEVILSEASIFKGNSDPYTLKLLFYVDKSTPIAAGVPVNEVGSQAVIIKKLTKEEYAMNFAKTLVCNILGLSPEADAGKVASEFTEFFQLGADGRTKKDAVTPLRGMRLRYSATKTTTKKGDEIIVPTFTPVKHDTPEALAAALDAGKAILDGKGEVAA